MELCQTGFDEEAELNWKEDRDAALRPCKEIKHVFARTARDSPNVTFLALEVGPGGATVKVSGGRHGPRRVGPDNQAPAAGAGQARHSDALSISLCAGLHSRSFTRPCNCGSLQQDATAQNQHPHNVKMSIVTCSLPAIVPRGRTRRRRAR